MDAAERERINKFLHVEVMGNPCWHDFGNDCHCQKPGCTKDNSWFNLNPDYCSSLDAVSEVEAKVVELKGESSWYTALVTEYPFGNGKLARAPAAVRARACAKAAGMEE